MHFFLSGSKVITLTTLMGPLLSYMVFCFLTHGQLLKGMHDISWFPSYLNDDFITQFVSFLCFCFPFLVEMIFCLWKNEICPFFTESLTLSSPLGAICCFVLFFILLWALWFHSQLDWLLKDLIDNCHPGIIFSRPLDEFHHIFSHDILISRAAVTKYFDTYHKVLWYILAHLTALEARRPRSRCQQGSLLLKSEKENL